MNVSGVLLKLNIVLILYVVFDSLRLSFVSVFKGTMNVKPTTYMDFITQIVEVIVIVVLLAVGGKEIAIAFGKIFIIFISIGGLCFFYLKIYKVTKLNIDSKRVKWFFYSGFFITIITIVLPFYRSIGIIILGNIAGVKAVGTYQASMGLIEKLSMLVMTVNEAVFPVFAGSSFCLGDSKSPIDFYFYLKVILILSIGAFAGTYYFGPYLIDLFFGKAYFESRNIIQILSVVVALRFINAFALMILVARKNELVAGTILLCQLIISVFFCYYLIPKNNGSGLAYAYIISEIIGLCICYGFIYFNEKLLYNRYIVLVKKVLGVMIFLALVIFISNKINLKSR